MGLAEARTSSRQLTANWLIAHDLVVIPTISQQAHINARPPPVSHSCSAAGLLKMFGKSCQMKMEHIAFNVEDPVSVAKWYVEQLGMIVKRHSDQPPNVHFMADDSGTIMIEIYGNTAVPRTDFSQLQPSEIHLAFLSDDLAADVARLLKAGATIVADVHQLGDDTFAMLRDPWGMPVQLVRRGVAMI